jgi:hypothetical protein
LRDGDASIRYPLVMRIALLLLLVACSKTELIRAEPASSSMRPQPTASPLATVAAPDEFPSLAALPKEYDALGKSCIQGSQQCGSDGRTAHVFLHVNGTKLPAGIATARHRSRNEEKLIGLQTVGLEGDRIWILSECPMCRIGGESIEVASLKTIRDEELAQIQTRIGLPASPLLRTSAAIKRAFDAAKG